LTFKVDEFELRLLGEQSRHVALADVTTGQHDFAETAVGLPRLEQRFAHGGRGR
jgi:hypothetical protein